MAGPNEKKKKFRSLSVSLALAFLALVMIVILISTSLNLYFTYKTQDQIIDSKQQLIAQNAAEAVEDHISDKYTKLEDATSLGNLDDASQTEQERVLDTLMGLEPAFRQLLLLDALGQELVYTSRLSSYATGQLTDMSGTLFATAINEPQYIGQVYIDNTTSEPMVIMAVQVTDIFGNFEGLLIAEVNLKLMWDFVDSIEVGETGVAYVVDVDGNLIAFYDISRVLSGENLNYLDEVNEFVGGSVQDYTSEVSVGIQGDEVITNHVPLGSPDWAVVVEMPVTEAYASVASERIPRVAIIILCLILAIVLGILLSKRITKPIVKLRDATVEISKGNLDTKIEVKSKNEIKDLALNFNHMVDKLKNTTVSRDYLRIEVAERKKLEVELQKTMKKLESKNKELEDYTYTVSHDLKTPLVTIQGFAELLHKKYDNKLDDKGRHYINRITQGTDSLGKLVTDLLELSRAGRKMKKFELHDFNDILRMSLSELEGKLNIKEVEVKHPNDFSKVYCDDMRIEQVLNNLIGNAVNYMGDQKKPTIEIGWENNGSDHHKYWVRDNGVGIKEEDQERIFRIFERNNSDVEGSGIGLSIVKKIIQAHGGDVWVESEYGKGSTFFFTLYKNEVRT